MAKCKICKKESPDGSQGAWRNDDPNLVCGNCLPEIKKENVDVLKGDFEKQYQECLNFKNVLNNTIGKDITIPKINIR